MMWIIGHSALNECAGDAKLARVANTPEGHTAIQRYLDRLEKQDDRNLNREVQHREMQSPAFGKEQRHEPVQAGGHPAGKQLCTEGSGGSDGHQAEHKPAMYPCGTEDK